MVFTRVEKHYPDYYVINNDGEFVRIHVGENNEITVYSPKNRRVNPNGTYYKPLSYFPIAHALLNLAINPTNQFNINYYQYTDSCLSLGIKPIRLDIFTFYCPSAFSVSKMINFTLKNQEITNNFTALKRAILTTIIQENAALTEEEKNLYKNYCINRSINFFDCYEKDYLQNKKLRNLCINLINSPEGKVLGDYNIFNFIKTYLDNLKIAEMKIETGNFWVNYLKVKATAEAIQEAKENEVFTQAQMKHNLFYENDTFITVIPTTHLECVNEGKSLNNCLGGHEWRNYLKYGIRQVVFIRRKTDPNKSYIACDIDINGNIIQYLTYCNHNVTELDALNFKDEYQSYLKTIYTKAL